MMLPRRPRRTGNNAGISVGGPLGFVPIDELRHQLEVNLIGQVAVTQAALPALRKARGRIVNMTSIGGRLASPFLAPYNASKYGLEAVTDALRLELRQFGIEVAAMSKFITLGERSGVPPLEVARAVEHALSATRPKTLGRDAKVRLALARLLPTRVMDRIVVRAMKPS